MIGVEDIDVNGLNRAHIPLLETAEQNRRWIADGWVKAMDLASNLLYTDNAQGYCSFLALSALFPESAATLPTSSQDLRKLGEPNYFLHLVAEFSQEAELRVRGVADASDFVGAISYGARALVFPSTDHVYSVVPTVSFTPDGKLTAAAFVADGANARIIGVKEMAEIYADATFTDEGLRRIILFERN